MSKQDRFITEIIQESCSLFHKLQDIFITDLKTDKQGWSKQINKKIKCNTLKKSLHPRHTDTK